MKESGPHLCQSKLHEKLQYILRPSPAGCIRVHSHDGLYTVQVSTATICESAAIPPNANLLAINYHIFHQVSLPSRSSQSSLIARLPTFL